MCSYLLGNLGPIRCAAGTPFLEALLDCGGAHFSLKESDKGRGVEDVHAVSSVFA
jgi:hypothetical protein